MIEGWLAGKLSGIIIFCLACAAIPLAIIAGVQTVRLDGISLLGWHWVDGAVHGRELAEQARDKALTDLGTARGNEARLTAGLDQCNGSIDHLAAVGKEWSGQAQSLIDAANRLRGGLAANAAAIRAIKSTDEKCPVADSIVTRGFQ